MWYKKSKSITNYRFYNILIYHFINDNTKNYHFISKRDTMDGKKHKTIIENAKIAQILCTEIQ